MKNIYECELAAVVIGALRDKFYFFFDHTMKTSVVNRYNLP